MASTLRRASLARSADWIIMAALFSARMPSTLVLATAV
jgi:hypothetical protein